MQIDLTLRRAEPSLADFVAVGEGGIDLVSVVPRLPELDAKTSATRRLELPGGQAATAAIAAARLGWRTRWIGATGDDAWGRALRDALHRENVDVAAVTRSGASTRTATVLVEQSSGRRAVVEFRDARLDLDPHEFPVSSLCAGRITLVDGTAPVLSTHVARIAREIGTRTMIDVDHSAPQTMALLQLIDVVILPGVLAEELAGRTSAGEAVAALGKSLPAAAVVIATLGADGAVAWSRGREVFVPAVKATVIDTTGAGDAFRAGFAARWLATPESNPDLSDLLEYAALVAALSCRELGAQTGLPTAAEVAAASGARV